MIVPFERLSPKGYNFITYQGLDANFEGGRGPRKGRFRQDLYYRLNVFPITVSPLRRRKEDIPPGTYAITVIHDENMNGNLNTNWLGIPKEGYGFSNDVKALLGAPPFSAASFEYDGEPWI